MSKQHDKKDPPAKDPPAKKGVEPGFTRLVAPAGCGGSVSYEGVEFEVVDGHVDVPSAAVAEFVSSHGFKE